MKGLADSKALPGTFRSDRIAALGMGLIKFSSLPVFLLRNYRGGRGVWGELEAEVLGGFVEVFEDALAVFFFVLF
ncbi:MAG: hypothetical protein J0M24_27825, partial [Verrucomicrobia bacterium]|nr:hypothetical protein [Verrucomicrobiota bacterium]